MSRIAGIVPAAEAGGARGPGRTPLERAAAALARGGCAPVLVVARERAGPDAELARRVGARVVAADPGEGGTAGLEGQLRVALRTLPDRLDGIAVLPLDHADVAPVTIEELIAAFEGDPSRTVVPTRAGRPGHPVLVPAHRFPELREGGALVPPDARAVPVEDPAVGAGSA